MAGNSRVLFTDKENAYAALWCLLGETDPSDSVAALEGDRDLLIPIALPQVNVLDVPLERVTGFRKRERDDPAGEELTQLRHQIQDEVGKHARELSHLVHDGSFSDAELASFTRQMEDNCHDLAVELRWKLGAGTAGPVFSRDVWPPFQVRHPRGKVPQNTADQEKGAPRLLALGPEEGSPSSYLLQRLRILKENPTSYA